MNDLYLIIVIIVVLLIVFLLSFDKFIKWNSDFGINSKQIDLPWRSAHFRPVLVQAMKQGKYNFNTIETNVGLDPILTKHNNNAKPGQNEPTQRWAYKARIYGDVITRKKYRNIGRSLMIDQIVRDTEKMGADVAQIDMGRDLVTFFKNPKYNRYSPRHISVFNRKYNPMIRDIYLEQVKNRKYTDAG